MQHAILCNGPVFRFERWGSGLSYELTHKPSGTSVFCQGDDAARIDTDFLAAEAAFPDKTTEQLAAWLWDQCEYGMVATPVAGA